MLLIPPGGACTLTEVCTGFDPPIPGTMPASSLCSAGVSWAASSVCSLASSFVSSCSPSPSFSTSFSLSPSSSGLATAACACSPVVSGVCSKPKIRQRY